MKIKLLRCPSCGSDDVMTTLKGCAPGHDSNRVSCCQCSEVGVAQDWIDLEEKPAGMVPENKPDDVMTLDLINEAMEKAKVWPYWCKPSEDGQEDDQIISESDLIANKALLRKVVLSMVKHGIVEYSGPVMLYDEEDRKPPGRRDNG